MNRIITDRFRELMGLCEKYRVQTLHLFGSAATDTMTPESDIDFLISFRNDIPLEEYADNFFDLISELENLFGRQIDLLEDKAIRNPVLRRSIDRSKQLVYGRTG